MSHKCAICLLVFGQFFLYQMHLEMDHPNRQIVQPIKSKYLTKEQKAVIVERIEKRLGKHNFYQGA